jgi:leucyl-tRNA---protein transferase
MEVVRFVEAPRVCSYLSNQVASLEYRVFDGLPATEFESLLQRGWRRNGQYAFRPACADCRRCRSIRIDVAGFRPSKSQRRALARNRHIRVEWRPIEATQAHVDLYNAWHADMHVRKGWPHSATTLSEYEHAFVSGSSDFAFEGRYFDGSRLVGVGLVDWLPHGLSSVYFYCAPEWRPLAPGVFSLLQEIEFCRTHGLPYLYLGYWIAECPSMAYKNRYVPHELLQGRPADDEPGLWLPGEADAEG